MPHDTSLIVTITMGLVLAFFGGLAAHRLSIPPIVGYLLAGIAIGPFTPGIVGDANIANQLAEIGIILLMFGIGLHFSINELWNVRSIALPGAIVQIAVATCGGVVLALLWGWSASAGLVLGLALSVASTVVLLRALEQRNELDTANGRIAVGWLIVEDLVMVLALVLLPVLAGSLQGDGRGVAASFSGGSVTMALIVTLGKVVVFVGLVVLVGTRVVPWLLQLVARTGSRELFTLSVLATALGIAYGSAELFGVSFALGAFFAGVVLSESDFSHQAAADSLPLQDAFAVLFFVSIGMLVDPGILVRQPLAVLSVVLLIVFGKSFVALVIVLGRGYPVRTALIVSASLAQIGEFSFILAGLGLALGILPQEGSDFILAGAIISIALNPLMFAMADRLNKWLQAQPRLTVLLQRSGDRLATLGMSDVRLRDHVIIVGFGRVGEIIGHGLKAQGHPFVAVDADRRRVEALRKHGVTAIYGDATAAGVLDAAGVRHARLLIVAIPQGFQKRRIIELAREANPPIDTAARTYRASEVAYLKAQGVGLAIMGEREVGFGLLQYALCSLGIANESAAAIVLRERALGEGGAFDRERDIELPEPAPELRKRENDESQ